jgi:hypothetical protein
MDTSPVGDTFGLRIPAAPQTLQADAVVFLDNALHAFGALDADNHVEAVTAWAECEGGSTGRKLQLSVRYRHRGTGLPEDLFVKFSRDFDNPRRDRGRTQMDLETRFAILARDGLPITVPRTLFADYHRDSGTGILITERIPFGEPPVEPHWEKCLDHRMPDPVAHYEALLTAVARLAGAHRAGRLAPGFTQGFDYDPDRVGVGRRIVHTPDGRREAVARLADFGQRHPGLFPAHLLTPEFVARMTDEVGAILAAEDRIMAELIADARCVALCHWNANVDNAWFWRDDAGRLCCGLLDWGCVSEMNVAMALWGSLCSAEPHLWEVHLPHLLAHFAAEFAAAGGPPLDPDDLGRMLTRYAVTMGVRWLLDAPAVIEAVVPGLDASCTRHDQRISDNEVARSQLLMLTIVLHLWRVSDSAVLID